MGTLARNGLPRFIKNLSEALPRFLWCESCVYYQLNDFELTGMFYYNPCYLMMLLNDAKYIHFLTIFLTSLNPTILKVEVIHNIIRILFVLLQMWLSCFSAAYHLIYHTIWISVYSINTFKNFLKRVVYIYTL